MGAMGTRNSQIGWALRCLAAMAEHSSEAVAVADVEGTLRFANSAWAEMHGYEGRRELVGRKISEFHTQHQMKTDITGFIEEVKRRGQLAGPVGHMRRDGVPFATETRMTAVRDEMGRPIALVIFVKDASEHGAGQQEALAPNVQPAFADRQAAHGVRQPDRTVGALRRDAKSASEAKTKANGPLDSDQLVAIAGLARRVAGCGCGPGRRG